MSDELAHRAEYALTEALEALRLTVEYVGLQTLHARPGWSWYDVLSKYPEYQDWLRQMTGHFPEHSDGDGCAP